MADSCQTKPAIPSFCAHRNRIFGRRRDGRDRSSKKQIGRVITVTARARSSRRGRAKCKASSQTVSIVTIDHATIAESDGVSIGQRLPATSDLAVARMIGHFASLSPWRMLVTSWHSIESFQRARNVYVAWTQNTAASRVRMRRVTTLQAPASAVRGRVTKRGHLRAGRQRAG